MCKDYRTINIEVDDGYYSFDYVVTIDRKVKKGSYDSDYENWTEKQWLKELEDDYAVKQALEQVL